MQPSAGSGTEDFPQSWAVTSTNKAGWQAGLGFLSLFMALSLRAPSALLSRVLGKVNDSYCTLGPPCSGARGGLSVGLWNSLGTHQISCSTLIVELGKGALAENDPLRPLCAGPFAGRQKQSE